MAIVSRKGRICLTKVLSSPKWPMSSRGLHLVSGPTANLSRDAKKVILSSRWRLNHRHRWLLVKVFQPVLKAILEGKIKMAQAMMTRFIS